MLGKVLAFPPLHLAVRALRSPPIFQIGFNKCGTTSLFRFLVGSGIPSVHWEDGHLAERMGTRMDAGQDPIRDYPRTIGFTDMVAFRPLKLIEPYKNFVYLHQWHPDALFVLNTRDREKWIDSRAAHEFQGKRHLPAYAAYLGIPEEQVPDFWRAEWETHHALVRAYFKGNANFLEFDIERDDPQKLVTFIARRYPQCAQTPFGVYNPTQ
jgi:hypothetical protein